MEQEKLTYPFPYKRRMVSIVYKGKKYPLFSFITPKNIQIEGQIKLGKIVNGKFEQNHSIRHDFCARFADEGFNYEIYYPTISNEQDGPIYGTIEMEEMEEIPEIL